MKARGWVMTRTAGVAAFAFLFSCAAGNTARGGADAISRIEMEEHMVPAADAGIELYLRNKHPQGMSKFSADRVVLFVHGATYPAETAFDLRLGGTSWMEYIAERGFDVWLVDVRGYGRSTRPPEMNEPPEKNAPIVRTDTALHDVSTAIDFILRKRGVQKLDLIGWSWGTAMDGRDSPDGAGFARAAKCHATGAAARTMAPAAISATCRRVTPTAGGVRSTPAALPRSRSRERIPTCEPSAAS